MLFNVVNEKGLKALRITILRPSGGGTTCTGVCGLCGGPAQAVQSRCPTKRRYRKDAPADGGIHLNRIDPAPHNSCERPYAQATVLTSLHLCHSR